jgi:hypothetical protein
MAVRGDTAVPRADTVRLGDPASRKRLRAGCAYPCVAVRRLLSAIAGINDLVTPFFQVFLTSYIGARAPLMYLRHVTKQPRRCSSGRL